jgi:ribosome-associated protein
MANFSLGKHPHVELCDLLKLEGWSESGAQAKIAIADGLVKVDGAVETRKRCKIVAGQTVSFEGQSVTARKRSGAATAPVPRDDLVFLHFSQRRHLPISRPGTARPAA